MSAYVFEFVSEMLTTQPYQCVLCTMYKIIISFTPIPNQIKLYQGSGSGTVYSHMRCH